MCDTYFRRHEVQLSMILLWWFDQLLSFCFKINNLHLQISLFDDFPILKSFPIWWPFVARRGKSEILNNHFICQKKQLREDSPWYQRLLFSFSPLSLYLLQQTLASGWNVLLTKHYDGFCHDWCSCGEFWTSHHKFCNDKESPLCEVSHGWSKLLFWQTSSHSRHILLL